jgi:hypothetical protein
MKRNIKDRLRAFKIGETQDKKVRDLADKLFEGNYSLALRYIINQYKA